MAPGPYFDPDPPRAVLEGLKARLPGAVVEEQEFRGELSATVPADRLLEVARALKEDGETPFEMLTTVIALHFPEGEYEHEVVYQLYSLSKNRRLRLKVRLRHDETAPSLTPIWPGANWTEREQFDLV